MTKAEIEAKKRYGISRGDDIGETSGIDMQRASDFIEGYHQAEKDLELTWEDIEKITDIWDDLHENEAIYNKTGCDTPEFYKEVLRQFKDYKKGKEK